MPPGKEKRNTFGGGKMANAKETLPNASQMPANAQQMPAECRRFRMNFMRFASEILKNPRFTQKRYQITSMSVGKQLIDGQSAMLTKAWTRSWKRIDGQIAILTNAWTRSWKSTEPPRNVPPDD